MKYARPWNLFLDMQKSRGRLFGLDVGDKYAGLAVSDRNNKIASPLSVLLRTETNVELMAKDFQTLVSEFSLVGVVVGEPTDLRKMTSGVHQVKCLVEDLCKTKKLDGLKFTYWDECLTSQNVELLLQPLNFSPLEAKTIVDKFAKVGILQGYLDRSNHRQLKPSSTNLFFLNKLNSSSRILQQLPSGNLYLNFKYLNLLI